MSKTTCIIIFLAGVAVGVSVSWRRAKAEYEIILQDELEAARRTYESRAAADAEIKLAKEAINKPDLTEYTEKLHGQGYIDYSNLKQEKQSVKCRPPYLITPDEFGLMDDYDEVNLLYFADDVLTDEDLDPIGDVANTVGTEFASNFGVYEPDSVLVRNERLQNDYEILRDTRLYSEVKLTKPYEADY